MDLPGFFGLSHPPSGLPGFPGYLVLVPSVAPERLLLPWPSSLLASEVRARGALAVHFGFELVRWKESHRQEWVGFDWKSRIRLGDRRE